MKNLYVSTLSVIIFLLINYILSDGAEKRYTMVEVVTPSKVVYDDGVYRTIFSSFSIFDKDGNKIIGVGEVPDTPAQIKLPNGTYKISTTDSNGKVIEEEFVVENECNLQVIVDFSDGGFKTTNNCWN